MMIGLVTGGGEEEGKSHCKVGTRWVRQRYDTRFLFTGTISSNAVIHNAADLSLNLTIYLVKHIEHNDAFCHILQVGVCNDA